MLKLEKANEQLRARNALLEEELARAKAAQALDKATRGSKKKQRHPEGQLFDPLYQEEHAEELAVRKEEARRKRRRTARARRNETEPNAAHACTPGPSGTS
ncbi:hypothetical protein C343_06062 [Cryptococcus neoformans C23]|uniref:Uncharacterized protein n=1 Tax=Cryptococcus neoformans (strain H99 / ATCC 208821 / CBS 10515 / FGSC 9487) TaxID=235443 RepID=T2BPQ6_CRYN9|nr:hypothetical protein CNAG_08005 [Cryptococcus neoformans var. grubii H99]AUB27986.1 hypothetical protein CKF44_08005 [Cryptococcus neoformans var. grubii]OWZ27674.1 hypothetical protein C347_06101 [Cryptococcus neoformans var. grubii AD2-60a]OWZ32003.1 hypothetical protein C353_05962 [Cryptococcus neoformans var. grubii AD1-83a]OWZ39978.1 hypothetical protein C343_06062 [Cryptococcus neoformans var. grubii C23]OXC82002.1 hypothetical protein C344_05781 [Cryptococcus neoformans var. grubii A|eukprot:XP_012052943.1 hypothetical protein CNAG_08005 [Cryptococcus neoformans var. grubii H99]